MGLNNLSIEEKRAWYSAQIQRLRDRKIEETKKKLVQRGYLDEDDYNEFACPEGYDWEPPIREENGEFYGYTTWAKNYESMVDSFPPVVLAYNSMAGNYYKILTRFRTIREGKDWVTPDVYSQLAKYDIISGMGAENHFCGDVSIGFKLGWGGLLNKVREYAAINNDTEEKRTFYAAEETFLLATIRWIQRTSDEIRRQIEENDDPLERDNLEQMLAANEHITLEPPRTLREACQFFSWYNLAGRCFNRDGGGGQLDELLRPYYEHDIAGGLIDDEDAVFYIAGLLYSDTKYFQLGGPDKDGKDMVSRVSWLIFEAGDRLNTSLNLTVRVHKNLDQDFFRRGIELLLKHKQGWPRFSGDDSLVNGLVRRGLPKELATRRIAVGCHWMATPGVEYTRSDTIKINLAKCFEIAWQDMLVSETHYSTDCLWRYFENHVRKAMELIVLTNDKHLQRQRENAPELFLNLFCYGPIEKGDDASHRTLEYYNICVDGSGIAVAADSFAALEQRIERENRLRWCDVITALNTNYDCTNGAYMKALLHNAEKYGQWNSLGEKWAVRISKLFTDIVVNAPLGEEDYVNFIPGLFSWSQTILLGKSVGATPNGRNAGTPINHGANPFPSSIKNGAMTTMSEAIAAVQCGMGNTCPFQMELDPGFIGMHGGVEKIKALLETHLARGGTLINVNIVDKDKILAANENPELYPDLVVRVTGFTAYFISLSPEFRQLVVDRILKAN